MNVPGRSVAARELVLAELGATDRQLACDVAELLASLAVRIGIDRTVTREL